jgi:hypothetical protein
MNKKFDINVRWKDDDNPDLSWLGEYKANRPDTLYIDRKNEVLINPNVRLDKEFTVEKEYDDFVAELEYFDIPFDGEEYEDDEDGNIIRWVINYVYWEKLSYSCRYDRNSYQFVESMNYQDTTDKEEYGYFKDDVKRLEDYGNYWNMRGCIVTASLNGVELGSGSLWGLESDMDDAQEKQFIDELTSEAIDEAKKNLSELHEIVVE